MIFNNWYNENTFDDDFEVIFKYSWIIPCISVCCYPEQKMYVLHPVIKRVRDDSMSHLHLITFNHCAKRNMGILPIALHVPVLVNNRQY